MRVLIRYFYNFYTLTRLHQSLDYDAILREIKANIQSWGVNLAPVRLST
jgi:hypothetical protein